MVSIIVPVYNVEKVLHYCIESILNQTYNDFELILVDDGSTDNSGTICDDYSARDSRVSVVHTKNGGVSKARNTGIEMAQGEFLCFIDSDDYIAEEYLEKLFNTFRHNSEYDNIWCGFQTTKKYGELCGKIIVASEDTNVSTSDVQHIMDLHAKWLSQMPWNKIYISSIVNSNHLRFPENMMLGEDLFFNLSYLDRTNGKILTINEPLNYYLQTKEDSLDNKFYPDLFEIYKTINKELYYYLTKWNCDKTQFTLYYNSCFYSYEKALRNTYHKKSNIKKKCMYNKRIMKSKEFQEALNKATCYIHPLYLFGYRYKLPAVIRLLDLLVQ